VKVWDCHLHGVAVRVVAADAEVLGAVRALLHRSGFAEAAAGGGASTQEPGVGLELACAGEPPAVPDGAAEVARHLDIVVRSADGRLYLDDGRSRVVVDAAARRMVGVLDPSARLAPPWSRSLLIVLYGLLTLLRYRGLYGLHAAGVQHGGDGYLVVAPSGGGKSTLALALVRQGWGFLSDDSVLLRSNRGRVEALPLRGDLLLKAPDPAAHPGERWEPERIGPRTAYRLPFAEAYASRQVGSCVPSVLLFSEVSAGERSSVEPFDAAGALFALLEHSTFSDLEPAMARAHLGLLTDLVRQCRRFRFLAGADVRSDPGGVARRLAALGEGGTA